MKPNEQKFLSEAMRLIKEDVTKKPFHIHGESGAIGNKYGEVLEFRHSPNHSISLDSMKGDKYYLHSHPPFKQPFTSSASELDHRAAAGTYLWFNNKAMEFVTNGKDVLHIHSTVYRRPPGFGSAAPAGPGMGIAGRPPPSAFSGSGLSGVTAPTPFGIISLRHGLFDAKTPA
jgi:hypothetical protein